MLYFIGVGVLFTVLLVVNIPWLYFLVDTRVLGGR
jgi:hypothetical protein